MLEITTLTNEPKQRHTLVLENNETVDFRLYFSTRCESWYFDFAYNDFICSGLKVVLSPNVLRQFKRILPFAFAFISQNNVEPFRIDDFSSGRVSMYILNEDDIALIEEEIYNE